MYKIFFIICNLALHCVWGDWVNGTCSAECDWGTQINTRVKDVEEANGGWCSGEPTETVMCKEKECPGKYNSRWFLAYQWVNNKKDYLHAENTNLTSNSGLSHSALWMGWLGHRRVLFDMWGRYTDQHQIRKGWSQAWRWGMYRTSFHHRKL